MKYNSMTELIEAENAEFMKIRGEYGTLYDEKSRLKADLQTVIDDKAITEDERNRRRRPLDRAIFDNQLALERLETRLEKRIDEYTKAAEEFTQLPRITDNNRDLRQLVESGVLSNEELMTISRKYTDAYSCRVIGNEMLKRAQDAKAGSEIRERGAYLVNVSHATPHLDAFNGLTTVQRKTVRANEARELNDNVFNQLYDKAYTAAYEAVEQAGDHNDSGVV